MKGVLAVLLLVSFVLADQFVPIPKKAYGFSFGAHEETLHIEAFLDLQCMSVGR